MDQPIKNTMARKRKPGSHNSTESIDSEATIDSTLPKETLALGLAIIRELEIDERGELLQRWMAHHLAETLSKAESATGEEKATLEAEAANLVLKLWSHRRALPDTLDPLGGYSQAIHVLKALHPDANPWRRFVHGQPQQKLLFDLFDAMSQCIVAGLELTKAGKIKKLDDAEAAHLEEDESVLLEQLNKWRAFLSRPVVPRIVGTQAFIHSGESEAKGLPFEVAVHEGPDGEEPTQRSGYDPHDVVVSNLRHFYDNLGELINQWNAKA